MLDLLDLEAVTVCAGVHWSVSLRIFERLLGRLRVMALTPAEFISSSKYLSLNLTITPITSPPVLFKWNLNRRLPARESILVTARIAGHLPTPAVIRHGPDAVAGHDIE